MAATAKITNLSGSDQPCLPTNNLMLLETVVSARIRLLYRDINGVALFIKDSPATDSPQKQTFLVPTNHFANPTLLHQFLSRELSATGLQSLTPELVSYACENKYFLRIVAEAEVFEEMFLDREELMQQLIDDLEELELGGRGLIGFMDRCELIQRLCFVIIGEGESSTVEEESWVWV